MMSRLRAATHIAIALALMSASLVMLAHALGLAPDPRENRLRMRELIAMLASEVAVNAAAAGDVAGCADTLEALAARNPDVRSIGLRLNDGTLEFASEGHQEQWSRLDALLPRPSEARIPILRDGLPFGQVEIRFRERPAFLLLAALEHPIAPLVAFVGAAGFLAYRLYMRRVLQYLDPSQVIPERVRLVLDSLAEGVLILDPQERIVLANKAWLRLTSADLQDIIGRPASSFDWRDATTGARDLPHPWIETIDDGAVRAAARLELATASNGVRQLSVTCAPILGPDGLRRGVLLTLTDLTEGEAQRAELEDLLRTVAKSRREIEQQNAELARLATTDPLTGCYNRRELFTQGKKHWAMACRQGAPLACLMVDVDHFKRVNDTHGHQTGDRVLEHVAQLLRSLGREEDLVARYGGEEFCLLLPSTTAAEAETFAERLRSRVESTPMEGLRITVSLGVADNRLASASLEEMLGRADQALYEAKRSGRNRVRTTSPKARGEAA